MKLMSTECFYYRPGSVGEKITTISSIIRLAVLNGEGLRRRLGKTKSAHKGLVT